MNDAPEKPKPRRLGLQFNLRSLMIAILVVGCCLGALATKIDSKQRERRTVAAIEGLDGSVRYNWQDEDGDGTPPGPEWLRELVGDDFFARVELVTFSRQDRQVSDDDLIALDLEGLTDLKNIEVTSDRVTDVGLARLTEMTELQSLSLRGVWRRDFITDAGIKHLSAMRRLERFSIGSEELTDACLPYLAQIGTLKELALGGEISDDGLRYIARMRSLETLFLSSDAVTDKGLIHLVDLKSLRQLTLSRMNRVTDAGVAQLGQLSSLRTLSLYVPKVTDRGIIGLARIASLEDLFLSCAHVTDEGLGHLGRLNSLRRLTLDGAKWTEAGIVDCTRVTEAGVVKLEHALPNCRIRILPKIRKAL